MVGYVYILEDELGTYYIGSSTNPDQRYKRHLSGFVHTTRRMRNPKTVFCQKFESIQLAKRIESKLKKLKRKDYIRKIIDDGYIKMK
jgi:predicted GIY-YIG superfamily endonuclease